jgi:D-glycero-alpha-D-manno-heptose-7-phosphate kinase
VIVNPLRIKPQYLDELENNLVLYYTDTTRASADIITEQQRNVTEKKSASVDAMHQLKEQSRMMKEALLQGRLNEIGEILDFGFRQKRLMAANISNDRIEKIYGAALAAGALGGKISGAGGGGFMMFYCPGTTRYAVSSALTAFGGEVRPFAFSPGGLSFYRDGMR